VKKKRGRKSFSFSQALEQTVCRQKTNKTKEMGDQEIIIELREMGFANKEQKFEAEKK